MTGSRFLINAILAAIVSLTAACKASESGAIPCNDDSNCPSTYAQCIGGGAGSSAGHCTEPVVGTPGLSPTTIAVTPPAITGGLRPTLALALPALSGTKGLARKVTLGLSVGGGQEPVNKSGGAPVTLADLGTTITVDAPASSAADDKTLTYTLTVSNTPSSAATATATGSVHVVPLPVLAASTLAMSPASITGGTSPSIAVALPALTSAAVSAASVSLAISGCGTGNVTKNGGAALVAADLGTTITINPPTTGANDNLSCIYTLTVANGATTAATTTATVALSVFPLPTLGSTSLLVNPAAITGGDTGAISITLPQLSSMSASLTAVDLSISGGGHCTGPVTKSGGSTVGTADLKTSGTTIVMVNAPVGTVTTDNLVCTYTLTVSSSATPPGTAVATGTLTVLPQPLLSAGTFTLMPSSITGGTTTPDLGATLPSLTSPAVSAVKMTFAISGPPGCGSGNVDKTNGTPGAVTPSDLSKLINFARPTTLASTSPLTCTYTLTVFNGATPASFATATGTLTVKPQPVLVPASLAVSPAIITGGTTALISITLPQLTSTSASMTSVDFSISGGGNCGSGPVAKSAGGAVATTDVKTAGTNGIAVNSPAFTIATDNLVCMYTLTVSNGTTGPNNQATASGTLTIVPVPTLSASTFTLSPDTIVGGSPVTTILTGKLPTQTAGTPTGAVNFTVSGPVSCGSGAVAKIDTTAVSSGDLGQPISFNGPMTNTGEDLLCKYTLSVSNTATPAAKVTASGTLNVVSTPIFASGLTVTPNVIAGGPSTAALLKFALPALTSGGTATSIAMTVALGAGATSPVKKTGNVTLLPGDLGTTVSVDSPASSTTATNVFNYSLTATNSAGTSTPATASVTSFAPTANIASPRIGATATLLPNGAVLITGGGTAINSGVCSGATNTAEVYDPTTGVTTALGSNMFEARCLHTAVLAGNKVFIMGGSSDATPANNLKVDVFLYNAGTASVFGAFQQDGTTTLPNLVKARTGHSATLLGAASVGGGNNVGKIAVVGGYVPAGGGNTVELFDPAASGGNGGSILYSYKPTSVQTTTLSAIRGEHAAVLIGPWLYIIGGFDGASAYSATIDVLDTTRFVSSSLSASQISTSAPAGPVARMGHAAVALGTGGILVAGGYDGINVLAGMQKYTVDNAAGTVTGVASSGSLATARVRFPMLPAGPASKFLVFGGSSALGTPDTAASSIELIDTSNAPAASGGGTLKSPRQAATATNLNLSGASNFAFLLAGGAAATGGAEIFIGP